MKSAVCLGALLFFAFPGAAQNLYRPYFNARFGTSVVYPANLLVPRPESDNGDGRRFVSRDGKIELLIYASRNVFNASTQGEMQRAIRDWKRDGAQLTYQKAGPNWFVLSGYLGGDIFYQKTLQKTGVFHSLVWKYPKTQKTRLDAPVTRSVRSFSVGKSLENAVIASATPTPTSMKSGY